jgi:hypothetical protein
MKTTHTKNTKLLKKYGDRGAGGAGGGGGGAGGGSGSGTCVGNPLDGVDGQPTVQKVWSGG